MCSARRYRRSKSAQEKDERRVNSIPNSRKTGIWLAAVDKCDKKKLFHGKVDLSRPSGRRTRRTRRSCIYAAVLYRTATTMRAACPICRCNSTLVSSSPPLIVLLSTVYCHDVGVLYRAFNCNADLKEEKNFLVMIVLTTVDRTSRQNLKLKTNCIGAIEIQYIPGWPSCKPLWYILKKQLYWYVQYFVNWVILQSVSKSGMYSKSISWRWMGYKWESKKKQLQRLLKMTSAKGPFTRMMNLLLHASFVLNQTRNRLLIALGTFNNDVFFLEKANLINTVQTSAGCNFWYNKLMYIKF